ncbi:LacI family DNA-binding transcriptional regulator [Microvirga antarctica]|uniref:LacI family DNA-binding transcriptional regulator n=1 Tax=Microvirga antarctica TaxID=2819233 RepID=UPI001B3118E2|nr:LacI family DNA-binding transcriptional regulator [Microvirga antarctica]
MKEIAERAKVTKMTVSRALRTPDKVAPETLRRITAAMEEMGFVPNSLAGSLSARNSPIVPVIVPTMANSIFSDFIEEVSLTLDRAGFTPIFGCSNFDNEYEERLLIKYLGWQPSAIILTGASQTPRTRDFCQRSGLPVIQTWCLPEHPLGRVVGFSNYDMLYQITKALQGWGYRNIGFGFLNTPNNDRSRQRRLGWEVAVREGGDEPLHTRAQGGELSLEAGADILRGILGRHPDTKAIAFGSDVHAVGAVLECKRLGLRIPDDIAITGCGDMGLSSVVSPTLTTVRIPGRTIGRECATMVNLSVVGTYAGPSTVNVGFEIVRRESA